MAEVILMIQSPEETRKVALAEGRLTIGRGDAADVRINDLGLSRLHASIYREGDRYWIVDEGSASGSYVNDEKVKPEGTALFDGDKISIGRYTTVWVSISATDSPAEQNENRRSKTSLPPGAIAIMIVSVLMLTLLLFSLFKPSSGNRSSTGAQPRSMIDNRANDVDNRSTNSNSQAINQTSNANDNLSLPTNNATQTGARRLYLQMSEAERLEFIYERARHISRMMSNREYQFTDDVVPYIKQYLDSYARRVGNRSTSLWGEDLQSLFARARRLAPYIIRAFNAHGVPAAVGLYIPMIESEYRECLTSPVGAKGLFQFMPDTARGYGVDPDDRCNPEKMAPAAAKYLNDRIAEFGTDAMSVALGIAGYNRSPDSVRRDLADVLNSENKERSFWTLVANSTKLDRYFQNENVKYVPKFFAAAIVGETPWSFGLQMNPLSTYTESGDGN